MGQVGIDRPGSEAQDAGCLVDISHLGTLKNQGYGRPLLGNDQVLLHCRHGK